MAITFLAPENISAFGGKRCLVRVDLNAEAPGYRLRAILPTVKLLRAHGVGVIIASHRGRFGKEPPTLAPLVPLLSQELGEEVSFMGEESGISLLENLRFEAGEEGNDPDFALKLASRADFYVNEAFPLCHRKNASITHITGYLPSFGGLRLEEELTHLGTVMHDLARPFVLVLGGAKISDKIRAAEKIVRQADTVLLGSTASTPEDFITDEEGRRLDIGALTQERYRNVIARARTIVWSGPMGLSEREGFEAGTRAVWEAIIANTASRAIVGGGETAESLKLLAHSSRLPVADYQLPPHVFLSTGGGAMLAYLAGEEMPGLMALGWSNP